MSQPSGAARSAGSLSRKIVLAACALTGLLVLGLNLIGYRVMHEQIERNLLSGLELRAEAMAMALENRIRPVMRHIEGLAQNALLARALSGAADRETYLLPFMAGIRTINDLPVDVVLVDASGEPIAANHASASALVGAQQGRVLEAVSRARPRAFVVDVEGAPHIFAVTPVVLPPPELAGGALVYRFALPSMPPSASLGGDASGAVVIAHERTDGTVLHHWPANEADAAQRVARAALSLPLDDSRLWLKIVAPRSLVDAPLETLARQLMAVAAITLVVVFLIAVLWTQRLTRPLRELAAIVDSITRQGGLAKRVAVHSDDEVGRLGRSFNAMLDRIAFQHETLEHQVATRTAALSDEVTIRERAEAEVRALNAELEARVRARTRALSDALGEQARAQKRLDDAQKIARIGSWEWCIATRRFTVSHQLRRFVASDGSALIDHYHSLIGYVLPEHRAQVQAQIDAALAGESVDSITFGFVGLDGVPRWLEQSVERVAGEMEDEFLLRATMQDVTERRLREQALRRLAKVFESAGEGIIITDAFNRIVDVNAAFVSMTGYRLEEVKGRDPSLLSSGYTDPQVYQALWRALDEEGHWSGELWERRKNGTPFPVWSNISVVRDDDGKLTNFIAAISDISEKKAAEQRIYNLAHLDGLTGLLNRASLEARLEQAMRSARRGGDHLAVLFIDLDRFKHINDSLGHQSGDELLIAVADRLRECTRECDIVARLGGDEFVAVLTGLRDDMTSAAIARSILARLSAAYFLSEQEVFTSPSIGISVFPQDGDSVELLLKHADTAMYHVKRHGRGNYAFFAREMNEAMERRMALEKDLRHALENAEFLLHYQPQLNRHGRIMGAEALIRWRHPVRGFVPPGEFIFLAEEIGAINDIGQWVLDEACRVAALWRAQRSPQFVISVNLSLRQLRQSNFIEEVLMTLSRHRLPADALKLEVTESQAMENAEETIRILCRLRELGVTLAIDDFGTGYSSLSYLKRLPIQTLKLDRSFVMDIETDPNDAQISSATLALAHGLGMSVCAEGVETDGQLRFLQDHQCDSYQGYLFSKPVSEAEMAQLLEVPDRYVQQPGFRMRIVRPSTLSAGG